MYNFELIPKFKSRICKVLINISEIDVILITFLFLWIEPSPSIYPLKNEKITLFGDLKI